MSTPTTNKDIKCELCGMTFATTEQKEEHKKLEHMEHHQAFRYGRRVVV
jgi:hypothetical protein